MGEFSVLTHEVIWGPIFFPIVGLDTMTNRSWHIGKQVLRNPLQTPKSLELEGTLEIL